MRKPQARPQMRPMMAARGIDVAGCPRETPPTKTTASIPEDNTVGKYAIRPSQDQGVHLPSRRTVISGSTNRTHLPLCALASTSTSYQIRWRRSSSYHRGRTLSLERLLELDAPFSLGTVHLKHGHTHNEDHDARDQLEDTYGWEVSAQFQTRG